MDVIDIQPLTLSIGQDGHALSLGNYCTKHRLLPLPMANGSIYYQPCYYCKNATKTIISLQAIVDANDTFFSWHQTVHNRGLLWSICFKSESGLLLMTLTLLFNNGLYYCPLDVLGVDPNSVHLCQFSISKVGLHPPVPHLCTPPKFRPVSKDCQLKTEVCSLRLGCPGKSQVDILPGNVLGLPSILKYHPFWLVDFHAQASVRQQAAHRSMVRVEERCHEFHMDFGFMRTSSNYYT